MKISKEDFESMKAKYDREVKKGQPGKGMNGNNKDNQTSWIFFDRATLEDLLNKADKDPSIGGIQFYFTQYTAETAEKVYPKEAAAYTGQMTLVMRAANLKDNKFVKIDLGEEEEYQNYGVQCPYQCEQEPTDT